MKHSWMAVSVLLWAGSARAEDAALRGFKPESSVKQREWEEKLRAIPDAARLRESMKLLSARPHHVGSAYGKQNAEWILARFKEYGWDARIETFNVLFPTPKERLLEMVEPKRFVASLDAPELNGTQDRVIAGALAAYARFGQLLRTQFSLDQAQVAA